MVYFNIWNNRNYKFPKQKHTEKSITYISFMFLWKQHSGNVLNFPVQAIVMVFIKPLKLSWSLLCSLTKFPKRVFFSYSNSLLILHSYNGIYTTWIMFYYWKILLYNYKEVFTYNFIYRKLNRRSTDFLFLIQYPSMW